MVWKNRAFRWQLMVVAILVAFTVMFDVSTGQAAAAATGDSTDVPSLVEGSDLPGSKDGQMGTSWMVPDVGGADGVDGGCGPIPTDSSDALSDYTPLLDCLPAYRWMGNSGSVTMRVQPTGWNIGEGIGQVLSMVTWILPNILLLATQFFWTMTLEFSQLTASLDLSKPLGHVTDQVSALLVGSPLFGFFMGFLALAAVVILFVALVKKSRRHQYGKAASISMLMIVVTSMVGSATVAAADGAPDTAGQVVASPSWMVRQVNDAVDGLANMTLYQMVSSQSDSNLMASTVPIPDGTGGDEGNCQTYLNSMTSDYVKMAGKSGTDGQDASSSSALAYLTNVMWEETALRQWVQMQYGASTIPKSNTDMVKQVMASNAQAAYCHTLESAALTPAAQQWFDTQGEFGVALDKLAESDTSTHHTASDLFNMNRWLSDWEQGSGDEGTGQPVTPLQTWLQSRQALFFLTCTPDGARQSGDTSGGSWGDIANNAGGYNQEVRPSFLDNAYRPSSIDIHNGSVVHTPSDVWSWGGENGDILKTDADNLCKAAFTGSSEVYYQMEGDQRVDKSAQDMSMMPYVFDIPNTPATIANAFNGQSPAMNVADGTAKDKVALQANYLTLNHLYGNASVDTSGAFGAFLGSILSWSVFNLFNMLVLIIKILIPLMGLGFVFACAADSIPKLGERRSRLVKWLKSTTIVSSYGLFIIILTVIVQSLVSILITMTAKWPTSLFYNVIVSLAPLIAILVLVLVLHLIGINPTSLFKTTAIVGAVTAALSTLNRVGSFRQHMRYLLPGGSTRGEHSQDSPQQAADKRHDDQMRAMRDQNTIDAYNRNRAAETEKLRQQMVEQGKGTTTTSGTSSDAPQGVSSNQAGKSIEQVRQELRRKNPGIPEWKIQRMAEHQAENRRAFKQVEQQEVDRQLNETAEQQGVMSPTFPESNQWTGTIADQ